MNNHASSSANTNQNANGGSPASSKQDEESDGQRKKGSDFSAYASPDTLKETSKKTDQWPAAKADEKFDEKSAKGGVMSVIASDKAAMGLAKSMKEGAGDIAQEVKHIAFDVAGQAKKTAELQLSGGKDRAAEAFVGVADALRHTGEHLRSQDNMLTDYVESAADKVEAASDYIQHRTLGQIIGDVENFARREPALFFGGSFLLGLLGGRFLKSSRSPRRGATGAIASADKSAGGASDKTDRFLPRTSGAV